MDTPERRDGDPETDRLLERELREAVGEEAAERAMERADEVRAAHAAPGTPAADERTEARGAFDAAGDSGAARGGVTSWITSRGPLLALTLAAAIVVGVIVSLATGSWWALVAALAVHAAATLVVATTALRLTTETEHVSSELAARLEEEGVQDPDRAFTELAAGAAAPGDVVRDGRNERSAAAGEPAAAAREQRTAMTPGSTPTQASDGGRTVGLMPPAVVIGSLLVALVAAIVVGEAALWGAVAIAWVAGGAWLLLTRRGAPAGRNSFALALVGLVVAVAVFGVLMGVLSDRL